MRGASRVAQQRFVNLGMLDFQSLGVSPDGEIAFKSISLESHHEEHIAKSPTRCSSEHNQLACCSDSVVTKLCVGLEL